jgi:CheY-like chemotaxis protein
VDDEPFNIITMGKMLKNLGLKYDFCYNGKQALEKVKEKINHCLCGKNYFIIILDIDMP